MKYGMLCLAAVMVAAGLVMADRFYRSEVERWLPLQIHNPSQQGLPLYEAKPPYQTVVAHLLPGRMIPYWYAGDQGDWWYGDYRGTEVVLKSGPRVKALVVQGHFALNAGN